jgi:hypothetical protein
MAVSSQSLPRARPWPAIGGVCPGRAPGDRLGVIAGVHLFCAVLAWSRARFVRFAADERQATTLAVLAEGFEVLGGVPKVLLADPDELPQGRGGGGRPTAWCPPRNTSGSPRTTGSGRTSARRSTRSPRVWWRTSSGTARTTCRCRCCSSTPCRKAPRSTNPSWRQRFWPTFLQRTRVLRRGAPRSTRTCTSPRGPSARPHRRPRRGAHP